MRKEVELFLRIGIQKTGFISPKFHFKQEVELEVDPDEGEDRNDHIFWKTADRIEV